MFYTYLFADPKSGTWCYVGKGKGSRWRSHFSRSTNRRLGNLIKKRVLEGFEMKPVIIEASDNADAVEMETLLIAMLGREDRKTGTLFNLSDGGEGNTGRIISTQTRERIRAAAKAAALRPHVQASWKQRTSDPEFKRRNVEAHQRACTVDGHTIFPSVKAMIQTLGQGKNGTRSSTFRFVSGDQPAA